MYRLNRTNQGKNKLLAIGLFPVIFSSIFSSKDFNIISSLILSLILSIMFGFSSPCWAASNMNKMKIQIFSTSTHRVNVDDNNQNVVIEYYNLDQFQSIINQINVKLSALPPEEAKIQAKQLIEKYQPQLQAAGQGIKYAQQYNITKVPAIIFDNGVYKVFGQTDLQTAIQEYRQWQKQKKPTKKIK